VPLPILLNLRFQPCHVATALGALKQLNPLGRIVRQLALRDRKPDQEADSLEVVLLGIGGFAFQEGEDIFLLDRGNVVFTVEPPAWRLKLPEMVNDPPP
jgi:hypothetical protein